MFNILISIDKLYTLMGYRMRSYVDCFSLWNFYKQCTSKEYMNIAFILMATNKDWVSFRIE